MRHGFEDLRKFGHFFSDESRVFEGTCVEALDVGEGHFAEFSFGSGGPFRCGVVADDDFAVGGSVDVEFDGVGVLGPREFECGHGIFGGFDGFAAVRDELYTLHGKGEHSERDEDEFAHEHEDFHALSVSQRRATQARVPAGGVGD